MTKTARIQIAAILLVVAICGVLTYLMYFSVQNPAHERALKKDFGTDLMSLCDPPPDDAPIVNATDPHPPLKVLALTGGGTRWHAWSSGLPSEWKATNRTDVGLVVCVQRVTVESYVCQNGNMYGAVGGGMVKVDINRVTVIDPWHGWVLARLPFETNAELQACGAEYDDTPEQFLQAIRPYILGSAS